MLGLLEVDEALANCCIKELKQFRQKEQYKDMQITDVVEDYAVHHLRWIKIGNAYGYNNGETVTAADYDGNSDIIAHYREIGYFVSEVHVGEHRMETISDREYAKLSIKDVIRIGGKSQNKLENLI